MKLRCSWDRNNPRLLGKQPSEGYLSRCRPLSFCDLGQQINQRLIRFSSLRAKARDNVAEIGTIELRIFVDLAREEALTKRAKWNESDPEFFEGWQQLLFRASPPQRVFALNCRDRLDSVCATDGLHSWFRKAEVLRLALLNEVLHCAGHILDRHAGVNTVLVEEIDDIGLQSLEGRLSGLLDVVGPTI